MTVQPSALQPSPVRNLTVVNNVDYEQSLFLVNISWTGPSQPEGMIRRFVITISSRLIQELYRDVVDVSVSQIAVCVCVRACVRVQACMPLNNYMHCLDFCNTQFIVINCQVAQPQHDELEMWASAISQHRSQRQ